MWEFGIWCFEKCFAQQGRNDEECRAIDQGEIWGAWTFWGDPVLRIATDAVRFLGLHALIAVRRMCILVDLYSKTGCGCLVNLVFCYTGCNV